MAYLSIYLEPTSYIRSAAVISIGAATLADIYEPHERGTMMGVYYWYVRSVQYSCCVHNDILCSAPLLGPSLGPIIGGALTQGFSWRATFYFLAIFTGLCGVSFIFFKDTFRRERSLVYQLALKRNREQQEAARRSETSSLSHVTIVEKDTEVTKQPTQEPMNGVPSEPKVTFKDVEAQVVGEHADIKEVKLSLTDIDPVRPIIAVLRRMNNLVILFASGEL